MPWREAWYCRQYGLERASLTAALHAADESAAWDAGRIAHEQARCLRDLFEFAARHVSWYRDWFERTGRAPRAFDRAEALVDFPILRREDLAKAAARLVAEPLPAGSRAAASSGSTGKSVRTLHDPAARVSMHAMRGRALARVGARLWDRQGLLVSQRMSLPRRCASCALDRLSGRRRNATEAFGWREARATARRFARFRPTVLLGQPTYARRLVQAAAELGLAPRGWGVRVALCNAEVLTPYVQRVLSDALGCGVLNEYGCTEVGSMAHACPRGTLHLNPEHVLVEIVDCDGRPVPPGTPGEVLLTSLRNRAMPLIRYAVGDVAVRAAQPCACGLQPGYAGLASVEGRARDVWRDARGAPLAALAAVSGVQEALERAGYGDCQLIQKRDGRVEVRAEPCEPPPPEVWREVESIIRAAVGEDARAVWGGRPAERSASGKLAVVGRE